MTNGLTPTDPSELARREMERIDRERLADNERTSAKAFRKELEELINKHSRENGSNTPDFILAEFLVDCLAAWDKGVSRRNQWYAPDERQEPYDGPNPT